MKTAISIPDPLFKRVERASRSRRIPRSQVVAEALEEHFSRVENQELLDALNRAYAPENAETAEERETREAAAAHFFKDVAKD